MQLTQKETELLKDLPDEEKLCIEKYTKHSSAAKDAQLKNLFSSIATVEKEHLKLLDSIATGTVPTFSGTSATGTTFTAAYGSGDTPDKQNDCYLCTDVLTTEKHASHLYDTCIFEFDQQQYRQALGKIQKEEQEHGKLIYDYMKKNSMYS